MCALIIAIQGRKSRVIVPDLLVVLEGSGRL